MGAGGVSSFCLHMVAASGDLAGESWFRPWRWAAFYGVRIS